jgi:putative N-acetylmannosamine-6-phosphate epimerase
MIHDGTIGSALTRLGNIVSVFVDFASPGKV